MTEEHRVPDFTLASHEQNFRDLFHTTNALKVSSAQFMTLKGGVSFFLGTLVTLVIAFMGQSYMQNQTFLEVRKQDQANFLEYQRSVDTRVTSLRTQQTEQKGDISKILQLQAEVRNKLFGTN